MPYVNPNSNQASVNKAKSQYARKLHEKKIEYLREHGFEGHIKNVNYWYRRIFNNRRGKSASERVAAESTFLKWKKPK